ncbi:SERTA domain-containing protein 3 [Marasmius crinis-equi]|uniref:SERTA domain-containing protein 3 n=1 Tax=Marasmius crinis-equi TaxID=585013 RepID=A0ABR3EWP6_9AGAR
MHNHLQERRKHDDYFAPVLKRLAGEEVVKPGRKRAGFNIWQRQHKTYVDSLIEEKNKEFTDKGEDPPGMCSLWNFCRLLEIVKAEYKKLSDKEHAEWEHRAEKDQAERIEAAKAANKVTYPDDPSDRQGAIKHFPLWLLPILEEAKAITGLHISVFAGG